MVGPSRANLARSILAVLFWAALTTCRPIGAPPAPPAAGGPGRWTLDLVDVGTGLSVVVRGEDFALIYDGGSNDDLGRGEANRLLAFLAVTQPKLEAIDHVILSHPHQDHLELLPDVFARYGVRHVWEPAVVNPTCGYRAFLDAVAAEPGIEHHAPADAPSPKRVSFGEKPKRCYGETWATQEVRLPPGAPIVEGAPIRLGAGASMTFLHASGKPRSNHNESSLVVRLDLGPHRVLLMGDAEAGGRGSPDQPPAPGSVEGRLLACCAPALAADVLVVGHHGSRTSTRRAFLEAVAPRHALISSGPRAYHAVVLPDPEVVALLEAHGAVHRTDARDAECGAWPAKVGTDADGRPGGCDHVRVTLGGDGELTVKTLEVRD